MYLDQDYMEKYFWINIGNEKKKLILYTPNLDVLYQDCF